MGDSLLAVVGGSGFERLGTARQHFAGWPMTRDEVNERLQRGTERLRPGDWVVVATDGYTDFVKPGPEHHLTSAAAHATTAAQLVDAMIEAACDGGAGDNVAAGVARVGEPAGRGAGEDDEVADRIRGAFFGGAIGDALGYPVEFLSLQEIRKRHGARGVTDYTEVAGTYGVVSDDTQMTLFTAEGIMRAAVRQSERGICAPVSVVDHAYARWMRTQGNQPGRFTEAEPDGWLWDVPQLHARRAPGNTCLAALSSDTAGTTDAPINNSKGCGGVMRVGPAGLILDPNVTVDRFEFASDIAALTHGHPSGHLAAGALAVILDEIVRGGRSIGAAVQSATDRVRTEPGHEETYRALVRAMSFADAQASPSVDRVEALGQGWVAEEALAIGVYCALVAEDFEHGVLLAVNHCGDSDSTGQIAGTILGAALGAKAIHGCWLSNLEIYEELNQVVRDWMVLTGRPGEPWPQDVVDRYPGW